MAVNGKQLLLKWNMLSHVAVLMSCATHIISPYLLLVGLLLQHVAIFNLIGALTLFSCDQAALWMVQSVRLYVRPSVTPFWLCSHHRIITKFSGVITNDKSDVHTKSQGQRSMVKVTEVKKIVEFDPDWAFPDCNSSLNSPMATKWCPKLEVAWKRCPIIFQAHPSNCKVTRLKKSSILTQIRRFRTVTPVWIHQWLRNGAQSLK